MKYISLFSGIEAASVAWESLGWTPVVFSEIEKFPCEVLAKRFPHVPNEGDISKVDWSKYRGSVDVVIGGSPCQSFSVAGLRKGLMDPRGNLMLEYLRAVSEIRPKWVIWENVPGVLSSNGGKDFASLLGGLEELGYGFAYRVLDAQFFGVAQRRRRVFVVGCLGSWQCAAAVLFEPNSVSGNTKTSREKREELTKAGGSGPAFSIAGNIIGRSEENGGNGVGVQEDISYTLTSTDQHGVVDVLPFNTTQITSKQNGNNPQWGDPCHTLAALDHAPAIAFSAGQSSKAGSIAAAEELAPTLRGGASGTNQVPTVCLADDNGKTAIDEDLCGTLKSGGGYTNDRIVGALCARDYKGVGNQYVSEGKLVIEEPIVMAPSFSKRPGQQIATSDANLSYAITTGEPPRIVRERVRRLTPTECERLQGFPDGWTDIYDKTPDSPRYKALGNSMAVTVIKWLGERIELVENTREELI